jgi:hypothetical protein
MKRRVDLPGACRREGQDFRDGAGVSAYNAYGAVLQLFAHGAVMGGMAYRMEPYLIKEEKSWQNTEECFHVPLWREMQ